MADRPAYAATPLAPAVVQVSAANTNRDGTGTLVEVMRGVTAGVVVEQLIAQAVATSTPGMLRFFLSIDNGTTKALVAEKPVESSTVGASAKAWRGIVDDLTGLTLTGTTTVLYAATHNAETFNIIAQRAGI